MVSQFMEHIIPTGPYFAIMGAYGGTRGCGGIHK